MWRYLGGHAKHDRSAPFRHAWKSPHIISSSTSTPRVALMSTIDAYMSSSSPWQHPSTAIVTVEASAPLARGAFSEDGAPPPHLVPVPCAPLGGAAAMAELRVTQPNSCPAATHERGVASASGTPFPVCASHGRGRGRGTPFSDIVWGSLNLACAPTGQESGTFARQVPWVAEANGHSAPSVGVWVVCGEGVALQGTQHCVGVS